MLKFSFVFGEFCSFASDLVFIPCSKYMLPKSI